MITKTNPATGAHGFTLIELMVVVAIMGILAVIAIPNYAAYVQRSRIIDATTRLGDFRIRMEQYFLDNRTYLAPGGNACGIPDPPVVGSMPFLVQCNPIDARNYLVRATGQAALNMNNFIYTIDQNGVKVTQSLPAGWTGSGTNGCWVIRKDGTCI